MRFFYLAAAVGIAGAAGLMADVQVADAFGLGQQYPQACASGYHPDAQGNCQPNSGQINRFCAPGLVYEPDPLGWRCELPPQQPY